MFTQISDEKVELRVQVATGNQIIFEFGFYLLLEREKQLFPSKLWTICCRRQHIVVSCDHLYKLPCVVLWSNSREIPEFTWEDFGNLFNLYCSSATLLSFGTRCWNSCSFSPKAQQSGAMGQFHGLWSFVVRWEALNCPVHDKVSFPLEPTACRSALTKTPDQWQVTTNPQKARDCWKFQYCWRCIW